MNILCKCGFHDYDYSYIGDVEVKTCKRCHKREYDSRFTEWEVIDTREYLFKIMLIKQRTNIISGIIEVEEEVYTETSQSEDDIHAIRQAYNLPPLNKDK